MTRWQPLTFRESVGRFKSNDKFIQNRLFNRLGGQALRYILAHRLAARNRRLAGIPRDEREQRLLDEGILVIENFLPPDIFEKVKAENAYADEDPRLRKAGPDLQGVVLYNANISPKTHPFTTECITEADEVRRLMSVFDGIVEGKSSGRAKIVSTFERNVRALGEVELKTHSAKRVTVGNFHLDSFMPITKARFTLNGMTAENGAFEFCRGTHKVRLSTARFHFSNSLDPLHYRDGLFTTAIPNNKLEAMQLKPELITCPANSLILANTSGFHRRSDPAKLGDKRDCITIDRRRVAPAPPY